MGNLLSRFLQRYKTFSNPIIVVSGLPRSGTSMMMGMLEGGGLDLVIDSIRSADADNPKGYYEFERVKDLDKVEDTSWLGAAQGKGLKVISFLLQHLPDTYDYKIIFMRRSIDEVLASQSTMLARRAESMGETSDEDMASIFARHLKKVEALIDRRPNCDVMYVDYRETLDSPATVAEQVGRFLGKSLDVEKMARVADKQLYRNRATVGG